MSRPARYWISFARSNFAVPTPPDTVQLMLWKRGSAETSASAIFVNRTGIGLKIRLVGANETAAQYSGLNPPRVLYATYIASGSGLKSAIAEYDVAAVHACGSEAFGMPSPS